MEINTEINKVLGTEMAKLFASTISEEEMKETARKVWENITEKSERWDNGIRRRSSDLEDYITNVFLKKIHEKILDIFKETENDEFFEKRARKIVDEARKTADEAIVKSLANKLVERALNVWNEHDKFVDDALQVLYVEKANGRL